MNTSIITMTCTYNYGATLQAFALQTYIEMLGHNCNVIDHMGWNGHRTVLGDGLSKESLLKLPYAKSLERGYKSFELFYSNRMNMTCRYNSIEDLRKNPPDSNVFITGSDQVWNPRDLRGEFYLDFVPKNAKKASYAASIGVPSIPEDKKKTISQLLSSFDYISTRESSAQISIQELTDTLVSKNCDPIFLISRDKWREIEKQFADINGEYILCYFIYKPDWINSWLRKLKKLTGKKIVVVGLNGYRPIECDKYIRSAGPEEFLWLIDHAYSVVSSSFHGIAFSILFGKPFVAMPDPPRPDRIHNLLNMFNLESNVLYRCDFEKLFVPYDYINIKKVIETENEKAKKYFDNIFE